MSPTLTIVVSRGISQADLAALVSRRNSARKLVRELRADSLRLLRMIEHGGRVEPGVHSAEVSECTCKGRICRRLLVDGRPVEDW